MRLKIKKVLYRILFFFKTKEYKHVKYILEKNPSDILLVSFSGFPGFGNRPSFNYMRTLKDVKINKLYLLDDFGYSDNPGSYYLGENGDWFLPGEIDELINRIVDQFGIKQKIMVGSSKGGVSALFYAIKTGADFAVIGAPQYHLGDYLSKPEYRPILCAVCGDTSPESVERLNRLMPDAVYHSDRKKPHVFIHYSPNEHTYREHIKDMIYDLQQNGFEVEEHNGLMYSDHRDVAIHFPGILREQVNTIVDKNKKSQTRNK